MSSRNVKHKKYDDADKAAIIAAVEKGDKKKVDVLREFQIRTGIEVSRSTLNSWLGPELKLDSKRKCKIKLDPDGKGKKLQKRQKTTKKNISESETSSFNDSELELESENEEEVDNDNDNDDDDDDDDDDGDNNRNNINNNKVINSDNNLESQKSTKYLLRHRNQPSIQPTVQSDESPTIMQSLALLSPSPSHSNNSLYKYDKGRPTSQATEISQKISSVPIKNTQSLPGKNLSSLIAVATSLSTNDMDYFDEGQNSDMIQQSHSLDTTTTLDNTTATISSIQKQNSELLQENKLLKNHNLLLLNRNSELMTHLQESNYFDLEIQNESEVEAEVEADSTTLVVKSIADQVVDKEKSETKASHHSNMLSTSSQIPRSPLIENNRRDLQAVAHLQEGASFDRCQQCYSSYHEYVNITIRYNQLNDVCNQLREDNFRLEVRNLLDQEEYESELAAANKMLEKQKIPLEAVAIEGDGNCFWRTIAYKVYNDENRYQEIKKALFDLVEANKEEVEGMFAIVYDPIIAKKMTTKLKSNLKSQSGTFNDMTDMICTLCHRFLNYHMIIYTLNTNGVEREGFEFFKISKILNNHDNQTIVEDIEYIQINILFNGRANRKAHYCYLKKL
jgi:hypothetical protein